MKKKYKIPRGYKIWKRVSTHKFGWYTIIAEKGFKVSMFVFNGVDDMPVEIWNYDSLVV